MELLTELQRKEIKKNFLKKLPIWNDIQRDVGLELDKIEFDVKSYTENIQRISDIINNFPKVSSTRRKVLPCKQHNNKDIIKLYSRNSSGELIIETSREPENESQTVHQVSASTPSISIDLLKTKPRNGDLVYAKVSENGPWAKCSIKSVYIKSVRGRPMTTFRLIVIEDNRVINVGKYEVARIQNHGNNLRAPKRVVAGLDETSMEPGIIGQEPCEKMNKNRYMVFLDNGSCQYFKPDQVYPMFYQSEVPWRDLQQLGRYNKYYIAELVNFFKIFPKRYLMEAYRFQRIEISRNGVMVPAAITNIDFDVMTVVYKDQVEESIHRGCPRLVKTNNQTSMLLKTSLSMDALYPKLLGNMKRYFDAGSLALGEDYLQFVENFESSVSICGNTARKSTGARSEPPRVKVKLDERVVFDDRDLLPWLHEVMAASQMTKHNCSADCLVQPGVRTEADISDIVEEFRDTCDLKVPLLLGWKRQLVKVKSKKNNQKQFIYESPCGRIFKGFFQIKSYINQTDSKFDVDYFTFEREVILNRLLGERTAYHFEKNIAVSKDGKRILENKFISLINPINEERLPIDFEYRSDTFPHPMLAAKGFSFNTDFKSGCDCEDDCNTRASCACHRLTEEAAGVTAHNKGQVDKKTQYHGKRLLSQNGIRIRMQVRKTIDKGWGVFVLDDVPKGSFICTYSAELLDDADQYGDSDMYYADLDYITIVEHQKLDLMSEDERSDEGFEVDEEEEEEIGRRAKPKSKSVKRPMIEETSDDSDASVQSNGFMPQVMHRYPKRKSSAARKVEKRNSAPQFRKLHSILNETQDYTLDARMQGNIGRFFNHSCDPNSMVQNVFIETHDLRFPVVAFFTKRDLKADDEINWHYNYKIDSIAGRQIACNCGASNCMGRIL